MPNTHGGERPGAGRVRTRFTLDEETARILREIVRQWRVSDGGMARWTAARALDSLVWREALRMGAIDADQYPHWLAVAKGEREDADAGDGEGDAKASGDTPRK